MPTIDDLISMYSSENRAIRIRAAQMLLDRGADIPLSLLVDILRKLSHDGLGAQAEKVLLARKDPDLYSEMMLLLNEPDSFVRQCAVAVLGRIGDRAATPRILEMMDDPSVEVRRVAVLALGRLKDPTSLEPLRRWCELHPEENDFVMFPMRRTLKVLGDDAQRQT